MKLIDILAIVTSVTADEHVIAAADQLASQNDGKTTGLLVGWLPPVSLAVEGWVVSPDWGDVVGDSRKRLAAEHARLRERLDRTCRSAGVESELLELSAARVVTGLRGRHTDISIVGMPRADFGQALVEGPLFESGRPVLVVPPTWKPRAIGKSVVICWKPTREAARALGDADSFLATASQVAIATIDARPSEAGYGPRPGLDIAGHLARRGVKAQLTNLDSMGRTEVQVIMDHVRDVDADLIVMGAYGRSRMSEFIFGGMTREMLAAASIPVLMSH